MRVHTYKNQKGICCIMKKLWVVFLLVISFGCGIVFSNTRNPSIFVNGILLDTEAFIRDGRTFVPLRAVGDALGAVVNWDEKAYAVNIDAGKNSSDKVVSDIIQAISPSVVAIVGNYSTNPTSYKDHSASIAHGTGVIIKSGGEILTNAHVVEGLTNIVVVLHDGSAYNGKVKFTDKSVDLAVVKIDKIGLPIVKFADSENVAVGDTVIAIGTPLSFSLRNSASKGIVSGVNRNVYSDYALIQTDASINPGNSGGPLVNMNGEVVGINSSKFAGIGIEGMCFSIPSDTVKYVLNQFERFGKVNRAKISATLDEGWAAKRGLPSQEGLTVQNVSGKAEQEGLLSGDIIISMGDTMLHSVVDLNECMKQYMPGDTVVFKILRKGAEQQLTLTLE